MSLPPGIGLEDKILCLKKALYGLKQAPLKWYEKLSTVIIKRGFTSLHFDHCVFYHPKRKTILVVYVDDLTIAGIKRDLELLIDHLKSEFQVTVKGPVHWLLGIEVQQTRESITLNQGRYIDQILKRFGMDNLNPVRTPLDPKAKLVKATPDEPAIDTNLYQRMIGSLMYLVTCTRPDLAFTVSVLSQFSSHPLKIHHHAVKRVFRYLVGTRNLSLTYPRTGRLCLMGFSDAAYGNCLDTRRSWSGYCFYFSNCLIS